MSRLESSSPPPPPVPIEPATDASREVRGPRPARVLGQLRRAIYGVVSAAVFALVLLILAFVSTQVFTRYVLHVPVNWLEEAARMALVWLVMLGAALAAERREHYVIDIVIARFPRRIAFAMLLLTNAAGMAFLIVLATTGLAYFERSLTSFYVSLNVPRGYVYIAVPIGAVLMAFSLLTQSIEAWFGRDDQTPSTSGPRLDRIDTA